MSPTLLQRAAAEAVGTFGLIFAGCGAIVIDTVSGGTITHVGVARTFGLLLAIMIYAAGHISGAHFNPAVTLALAATRHFPLALVPVYLAAQFAGAIAASVALRLLLGGVPTSAPRRRLRARDSHSGWQSVALWDSKRSSPARSSARCWACSPTSTSGARSQARVADRNGARRSCPECNSSRVGIASGEE